MSRNIIMRMAVRNLMAVSFMVVVIHGSNAQTPAAAKDAMDHHGAAPVAGIPPTITVTGTAE